MSLAVPGAAPLYPGPRHTRRPHRPFTEAHACARRLGRPTAAAWLAWARTDARPVDIPARPDVAYRHTGWHGWADWLGDRQPPPRWQPFPAARAHGMHLRSAKAWRAWSQSGARPPTVPSNPDKAYHAAGWRGWGDWLGTGRRTTVAPVAPFAEARAYARWLGLHSGAAWRARPSTIPATPAHVYRQQGWAGWNDWLGPTYGSPDSRRFRPYPAACAFARTLGLRSAEEWYRWAATSARPHDIPANPARTFREHGWTGFGAWLGPSGTRQRTSATRMPGRCA